MDCIEKIIPTVYEINTSIYKLMWRKKKLKPLPSLIFKPWSHMPPTIATLLSKQVNFNKIKVIVFGFMFVFKKLLSVFVDISVN